MKPQLPYKWTGEEAAILDIMLRPGRSMAVCPELYSRYGIKVLERTETDSGFTVILRHPLGALAEIHTDREFVVTSIIKYEGDEAASREIALVYRMEVEDRAFIEREMEVGQKTTELMIRLDQPNERFTVLERQEYPKGGMRYVMQGKLFGVLVIEANKKMICTSWTILEGEDAMVERAAIAQRRDSSA